MILEASITGLIKTIFIIGGVFLLLRFIGQFMIAKRNMEEERELNQRKNKLDKEREAKLRNFGKTKIVGKGSSSIGKIEDVDFEEIE